MGGTPIFSLFRRIIWQYYRKKLKNRGREPLTKFAWCSALNGNPMRTLPESDFTFRDDPGCRRAIEGHELDDKYENSPQLSLGAFPAVEQTALLQPLGEVGRRPLTDRYRSKAYLRRILYLLKNQRIFLKRDFKKNNLVLLRCSVVILRRSEGKRVWDQPERPTLFPERVDEWNIRLRQPQKSDKQISMVKKWKQIHQAQ